MEWNGMEWNILFESGAIYQNNDPNTNHSKSSKSNKYGSIIQPIWDKKWGNIRDKDGKPIKNKKQTSSVYFSPPPQKRYQTSLSDPGHSGSGLHKYTELPKEYVWMNDVRKLVDRLVVILGEEESGNDNLYNEKVSILKMFSDMLTNFILQDPKNIGHLIKIINMLPPKFWSTREGSGFVNDIINKLPYELHVPGYSYCGPGTRLEERLARGDQGVNPLDESCKVHDIAYRDNKDLESRHAADKVLEKRALERVVGVGVGV